MRTNITLDVKDVTAQAVGLMVSINRAGSNGQLDSLGGQAQTMLDLKLISDGTHFAIKNAIKEQREKVAAKDRERKKNRNDCGVHPKAAS